MKKLLAYLLPLILWATTSAVAQYGANCQGCGVGADIDVSSIHCFILNNNNPADHTVPCQQNLNQYGTIPSTADPTTTVWDFNTFHNSYGEIRAGCVLNVTDRIYADTTVGLTHVVVANHVVPAGGNGGSCTYYATACQNGFPCNQADPTFTSYPGPTGSIQGRGHLMSVYNPPSNPYLPVSFDFNPIGHQTAQQGYPTYIPILSILKSGMFPTTLPASATTNNLALKGTTPNGGTWYVWNGSTWVQTAPVWYLTTLTITDGLGNTFICHPDAAGNHIQNTGVVENTCKTTGGTDSHSAVIVFYPGQIGPDSSDARPITLDTTTGQYTASVGNTTAPPGNPQPNMTLEYFPGTNGITTASNGTLTANVTFTLYTDSSSHVPAVPSTTFAIHKTIVVTPPRILGPNPPSVASADATLLPYWRYAGFQVPNWCSNASNSTSLAGWHNPPISTWLWIPVADGDFNELYPWNYDPGRTYHAALANFLAKMSGAALADWAANTTYGDTYDRLIIKPTANNPNGFSYMATNQGVTFNGAEPLWSAHVVAGATFTDGTVTWEVLGNQAYIEGCIQRAQNPYINALVLSGGTLAGQASQFVGGALETQLATGDAYAQDGTFKSGLLSRVTINSACATSSNSGACSTDHGGYGISSPWNVYSQNAGRGIGKNIMNMTSYWIQQEAAGTPQNFTNDLGMLAWTRRFENAAITWLDYVEHQSNVATVDPLDNWYVANDPFMFGIVYQALIEIYDTSKLYDPTNSLGILDARIPAVLQDSTSDIITKWFNQPGALEGINTYSFGFTPHDIQVVVGAGGVGGTKNAFYNELQGPIVPTFSWLYNFCGGVGGCTLANGETYDVAADQIRLGNFAGTNSNCSNSNWKCAQWPDGQWLHFWVAGVGSPKQFGQAYMWGLFNDEQWRSLSRTWASFDMLPDRNPCRDGSNGNLPCAVGHFSPYADTTPAYPFQPRTISATGGRYGGYPYEQLDPTNNVNGVVIYTTTLTQAATAGTNVVLHVASSSGFKTGGQLVTDTGANTDVGTIVSTASGTVTVDVLHFNHGSGVAVLANMFVGDRASQVFNITANSAQFYACTYESTLSATVNLGTGGSCGTIHQSTEDTGFPAIVRLTTVDTWCHEWTVTGLTPATQYGSNITTVDKSNNTFTNNCTATAGGFAGGGLIFNTLVQTVLAVAGPAPANGTVGIGYNQTITANGGIPPYTWSVTPTFSLPPGLSISTSSNNGIISGTPTTGGTYTFKVRVTDHNGLTADSPLYTVIITTCRFTNPGQLANGQVGVAYSQFEQTAGCTAPLSFTTRFGIIPHGTALNATTGEIAGTPDTQANYAWTAQVIDANNQSNLGSYSAQVINGSGALTVTNNPPPSGTVNIQYTPFQFTATGGTGTGYTWDITSGSLPTGMSFTTGGLLLGRPVLGGSFPIVFRVTDSGSAHATQSDTLVVNRLVITINQTDPLPNAAPQFLYGQNFTASGGIGGNVWAISSGSLPSGITLTSNADGTATIAGTPTTPGTSTFILQVTDNAGDIGTKTFHLTVETPVTITAPLTLPNGAQFHTYGPVCITAIGGVGPYTFSLSNGSVPGLTFSSAGCFTGIPTIFGVYPLTVRATDVNDFYTLPDKSYSLTVTPGVSIRRTNVFGTTRTSGTSVTH